MSELLEDFYVKYGKARQGNIGKKIICYIYIGDFYKMAQDLEFARMVDHRPTTDCDAKLYGVDLYFTSHKNTPLTIVVI